MLLRFLLAAFLALAASAADTQGYSRAAQRVLAQARAASGGAGWNMIRGWHESGRQDGAPYERWLDPLRYGMRVEVGGPAGTETHGFNGSGEWHIAANGGVTGIDVRRVDSAGRTEAFFAGHGYFFPGRFDAKGEWVGVRRADGHAYDVVTVKPYAAQARELWFDRKTHLLARMVDRGGPRPVAVQVSDYRKVGPVKVAFRYALEGGGPAPAQTDEDLRDRTLEAVSFLPADRAMFSLPRPGG